MIEYVSKEITKLINQYTMFLESLKFIEAKTEKDNISLQMTKLVEEILDRTNEIYEEKYNLINESETYLIEEEKEKLFTLINLINERKNYIEDYIRKNKAYTDISLNSPYILGEDALSEIKKRIRIIDNYKKNREELIELTKELNMLNSKLTDSVKKIKANDKLNKELENRMIELFSKAFKEEQISNLISNKNVIIDLYNQLNFAYNTAKDNVKLAKKNGNSEMIIECDNNLSKVTIEYNKSKEQKLILDLYDLYDMETSDYNELKEKRNKINSILKDLDNTELYKIVSEEVEKQYNTIRIEEQDIITYNSLASEKDVKNKRLHELEEINNSEEYQIVLKNVLENEKKHREMLLAEERKKEYEERQRKLIEEKKLQEERAKRQRLIDEERKKEQEKRIKELLVTQNNFDTNLQSRQEKIENSPEETNIKIVEPAEIFADLEESKVIAKKEEQDTISIIKNDKLNPKKIGEEQIDLTGFSNMNDDLFPDLDEKTLQSLETKSPKQEDNTNILKFDGWIN